jgi:arylsulfatase
MGEWKVVRPAANGSLELYNLREDIGETRNVAAQNPKALARIEEYLKTARTEPRRQSQPKGEW